MTRQHTDALMNVRLGVKQEKPLNTTVSRDLWEPNVDSSSKEDTAAGTDSCSYLVDLEEREEFGSVHVPTELEVATRKVEEAGIAS